jgi:hypothetical protein
LKLINCFSPHEGGGRREGRRRREKGEGRRERERERERGEGRGESSLLPPLSFGLKQLINFKITKQNYNFSILAPPCLFFLSPLSSSLPPPSSLLPPPSLLLSLNV